MAAGRPRCAGGALVPARQRVEEAARCVVPYGPEETVSVIVLEYVPAWAFAGMVTHQ